ncbi:MAG: OmpA family protein [Candidatus Kapaibacterium sp.]|nr:OmpA family protein [Ignavibacteriota bacterium]
MTKLQKYIISLFMASILVVTISSCKSQKDNFIHVMPHIIYEFSFKNSETIELSDRLTEFLDYVVVEMQNNKDYILIITGHSDNTADTETNLKRAIGRANNVAEYVKKKGISSDRLKIYNKGASEPISNQNDDNSLALNRRVEIKMTL